MAISVPVAVTADDRSFRQFANRSEKWGEDTGQRIGKSLADGINDKNLDRAFGKVVDYMSKIRAETAKLQELQSRGASDSQVVAQQEKLIRLQNALRLSTNDTVRAYETLNTQTTGLASATNVLSTALQNTRFASVANDVERLGTQFGSIGLKMAAGATAFAALVVGAVEVTKAFYEVGERWDSISDSISIKTGKMGDDLGKLTDIVKDVGTTTAASFEDIANIVSQLSQSMPQLTDSADAVRQVTSSLAFLNANDMAVDVRNLGRAFQAFGIDSSKASGTLDELYVASTKTGIPINELITNLVNVGPAARTLGLNFDDVTGLLIGFEQAGIDANTSTMALNSAAKVFADSNVNLKTGLKDTIIQIKGYIDSGNQAAAVDLAGKVFGERGAEKFVDLIRQGKVGVDNLTAGLGNTQGAIDKARDTTDDWAQKWEILKNRVSELAENVGGPVFDAFNKVLGVINDIIAKPIEMPHGPSGPLPNGYLAARPDPLGAFAPVTPSAPVPNGPNPLDSLYPGAPGPGGGGNPLAALGPVNPSNTMTDLFPWLKDMAPAPPPGGWPADAPPQDINQAIEDAKKKGTEKEPKPSFPLSQYGLGSIPLGSFPGEEGLPGLPGRKIESHSEPGSYQVDPQKVFDAQTQVMSANKSVEEARKRILEVQADNTHTEQQLQSAKDALILADRNNLKAQQDLLDAQAGTWKKADDQTKNLTKNLSKSIEDFGASVDKDFGLSRGLPGLAENLAKFIGNIVAAPLLGPLGAIAGAQGGAGKTGVGLMGYLGATGAFGPGFMDWSGVGMPGFKQGQSSSTSSGSPTAQVRSGGWMGDAALLANVNRSGHYDNTTKDLSKGLVDCASGVEDLVNIIDGKSTAGGSLWTGNAAEVLPGMGFQRGMGGPGDFRIGYRNGGPGNGHMQATLPDGTNVNFGSTEAIQAGGVDGGMGAFDPTFTDHWYRPIGASGGGAVPGGGPSTAASPLGSIPIPLPVTIVGGMPSGSPFTPGGSAAPGGAPGTPGVTPGGGDYNQLTQQQLTDPGLTNPVPVLHRDAGGPLPPGPSVVVNNTGKPETVVNPQGQAGNQHVSEMFPGPGSGNNGQGSAPGSGPGQIGQQGPSQIGGNEPKAQNGASVGGGGGVFGSLVGAGAAAADAFAPGSGAAVQVAGQEIQRAIKAGGQAAGILTEGLMETFLPTGASDIANDNWLTRIAGGFVGLGPQLPNMAGKAPTPIPQQAPAQPMPLPAAPSSGGTGQDRGPTNVVQNIYGVTSVDKSTADMLKANQESLVQTSTQNGQR